MLLNFFSTAMARSLRFKNVYSISGVLFGNKFIYFYKK